MVVAGCARLKVGGRKAPDGTPKPTSITPSSASLSYAIATLSFARSRCSIAPRNASVASTPTKTFASCTTAESTPTFPRAPPKADEPAGESGLAPKVKVLLLGEVAIGVAAALPNAKTVEDGEGLQLELKPPAAAKTGDEPKEDVVPG